MLFLINNLNPNNTQQKSKVPPLTTGCKQTLLGFVSYFTEICMSAEGVTAGR
jgi:hypothetical protein